MNNKNNYDSLKETAYKVREHIIRMSTGGGCFIGASLSCADILVYLYKCYLNTNKENINKPERDYFFLSKGHDVPALYGTFVEIGLIKEERLGHHLKTSDYIYWHPNVNITGIEFHSGSLGHLLSVSMGSAYDSKLKGINNKTVVLLGDGELNEGSIWESAMVAASLKLDNLIAVVDRNHFQANMETERLNILEPLDGKFETFGWNVKKVNGHDFEEMDKVFSDIKTDSGKPTVVIAETVRGKGLPSIEARADRWFVNITQNEVLQLLNELATQEKTVLISETLMVR